MVVNSLHSGPKVTALRVGEENVRRYFRREVAEIDLRLDHLQIRCELTPEFWQDQPEIHDRRLCLWLEWKQRNETKTGSAPAALEMIRLGRNSFILSSACREHAGQTRAGKGGHCGHTNHPD